MDVLLHARLLRRLELALPAAPDHDGPVVAIAHSPQSYITIGRSGPRHELATPVLFAALQDSGRARAFGRWLHERTHGLAFIGLGDEETAWGGAADDGAVYLAIPAVFHVVDADAFATAVSQAMGDPEGRRDMAWSLEHCRVRIVYGDRIYGQERTEGQGTRLVDRWLGSHSAAVN